MPVEFLSEEQVARFGRFVADPSPLELERLVLALAVREVLGASTKARTEPSSKVS